MKLGVIFDLDGTLLDTLAGLTDAVNHVLRQFGCPLRSTEEVRQFVGNGVEHLLRMALPGNPDDPDIVSVMAAYRSYYNAHCRENTAPYAGIPNALSELAKEYPLAVVSNKPDDATKELCRTHFGIIFAMGEHPGCPRKPAPDMLLQAMAAIGADKCIYVGDSEVDVVTANNAGIPCLSVTWGFRDVHTLKSAGAAQFCHTPEELPGKIRQMASLLSD